jgi:hypothetical protein
MRSSFAINCNRSISHEFRVRSKTDAHASTRLAEFVSDNMEKQVQNVAIADAILHYELRIFVWDVAHNLKDRILAATAGKSLWSSIISAASRPMIEVSLVTRQKPRNIAEYWRRFSDHRLLFEAIRLQSRTLVLQLIARAQGKEAGAGVPPLIRELP